MKVPNPNTALQDLAGGSVFQMSNDTRYFLKGCDSGVTQGVDCMDICTGQIQQIRSTAKVFYFPLAELCLNGI